MFNFEYRAVPVARCHNRALLAPLVQLMNDSGVKKPDEITSKLRSYHIEVVEAEQEITVRVPIGHNIRPFFGSTNEFFEKLNFWQQPETAATATA